MIHLFHGENVQASRAELQMHREKFKTDEIINLNGKSISMTDLFQASQSDSFLSNKKLVIVENLFTSLIKKKTANPDFLNWLKQTPENIELIFWEEKKIPKTLLNSLPKKTDIAIFEYDRNIFQLMDIIMPGNQASMLLKFTQVIQRDSVQIVFAMLVRQLRLLIMAHDLGKNIPDLSPWQAAKITKQAQLFSREKLLNLYKELLNIDIRMKTSASAYDLTDELKMFLIKV